MSRRRRRQRGFTLVEVLIAATILFVVIAAAADSYRSALLKGAADAEEVFDAGRSSKRTRELLEMLTPGTSLALVPESSGSSAKAEKSSQLLTKSSTKPTNE